MENYRILDLGVILEFWEKQRRILLLGRSIACRALVIGILGRRLRRLALKPRILGPLAGSSLHPLVSFICSFQQTDLASAEVGPTIPAASTTQSHVLYAALSAAAPLVIFVVTDT